MPKFEIMANRSSDIGGLHIDRGQTFTINIPMRGISPTNLLAIRVVPIQYCGSSLRRDLIYQRTHLFSIVDTGRLK